MTAVAADAAAAHIGYRPQSFVLWVRRKLLPNASPEGLWDTNVLDAALEKLIRDGFLGPARAGVSPNSKPPALPNVQAQKRDRVADRPRYHLYFRPTHEKLPSSFASPEFMRALVDCERRWALRVSNVNGMFVKSTKTSTKKIGAPSIVSEAAASGLDTKELTQFKTGQISHPSAIQQSESTTFLTPEELSARYRGCVAPDTLANWRAAKFGPAFLKVGKAVLYRLDLLTLWEKENVVLCDMAKSASRDEA